MSEETPTLDPVQEVTQSNQAETAQTAWSPDSTTQTGPETASTEDLSVKREFSEEQMADPNSTGTVVMTENAETQPAETDGSATEAQAEERIDLMDSFGAPGSSEDVSPAANSGQAESPQETAQVQEADAGVATEGTDSVPQEAGTESTEAPQEGNSSEQTEDQEKWTPEGSSEADNADDGSSSEAAASDAAEGAPNSEASDEQPTENLDDQGDPFGNNYKPETVVNPDEAQEMAKSMDVYETLVKNLENNLSIPQDKKAEMINSLKEKSEAAAQRASERYAQHEAAYAKVLGEVMEDLMEAASYGGGTLFDGKEKPGSIFLHTGDDKDPFAANSSPSHDLSEADLQRLLKDVLTATGSETDETSIFSADRWKDKDGYIHHSTNLGKDLTLTENLIIDDEGNRRYILKVG